MTSKLCPPACERARAQLSAEADGELSELEGAELARHLAACGSCRAYRGQVDGFTGALRAAPLADPDFPIFVPKRRVVIAARLQVGAAAAAVLAVVALAAVRSSGHELGSSIGLVNASARPAYLDSASYEQRLIDQARAAHIRPRTPGSAVAT
jgi:predicted anti-sigma-YlaC factor YlaD